MKLLLTQSEKEIFCRLCPKSIDYCKYDLSVSRYWYVYLKDEYKITYDFEENVIWNLLSYIANK